MRSGALENQRLVARPLLAWHEMTCASPAYLDQYGEPQTPADLAAHNCLLNSHYSGREEWLYHQQHELLRVRVSGTFASNHYNLLKKAALVGAGIARLPSYVLPAELADGRLRWLLRDYQTRSLPMYLVHPYQGVAASHPSAGRLPGGLVQAQRRGVGSALAIAACNQLVDGQTPRSLGDQQQHQGDPSAVGGVSVGVDE